MNHDLLAKAKSLGFSDRQIAYLTGQSEDAVRALRKKTGLTPSYRLVDTCAAEFEAYTPYYYSTYDCGDDETMPSAKRKVMILGGGPNRIGQGIEFDYCCVHAAFALKEDGFETLMVNSNPETVSTDYDTSDKLFFEPLTLEDVLHIYEREKCWGAIAQFGGQTPLEPGAGPAKKRRQHHRHLAPEHRDRRGPQAVLRHAGQAAHPPAAQRPGHQPGRGAPGRPQTGLPRAGPPLLCPRRARHADCLFRRRIGPLHAFRRGGLPGTARPGGQIPGRRHRGGCGLHCRCRPFRRSQRRHHCDRRFSGAHRIRRRPFRRCRHGVAAPHPFRSSHPDHARNTPTPWPANCASSA